MVELTGFFDEISALMSTDGPGLDRVESSLTDGYAHALSLEAEKWRLEKRVSEVTQELHRGDTAEKTKELSKLAQGLDTNAATLGQLRTLLSDLRRFADRVRVAS